MLHFPHAIASRWREHRTVCLPDYQGVGIGNALSEFVASMFRATGKPYSSVTSNPAMIYHRAKSKNWNMRATPNLHRPIGKTSSRPGFAATTSLSRLTASFDYTGEIRAEDARKLGVI